MREVGDNEPVDVAKVEELVSRRSELRQHRAFAEADAVMRELNDMGVLIFDKEQKWFVQARGPKFQQTDGANTAAAAAAGGSGAATAWGGYQQPAPSGDASQHDPAGYYQQTAKRQRLCRYAREPGDTAPVDVARVEELLAKRTKLRQDRKFNEADAVMYELNGMGVTVFDKEWKWFVGKGGPAAAAAAAAAAVTRRLGAVGVPPAPPAYPSVPAPLPHGWATGVDPSSGRTYYIDITQNTTQWHPPPPMPPAPPPMPPAPPPMMPPAPPPMPPSLPAMPPSLPPMPPSLPPMPPTMLPPPPLVPPAPSAMPPSLPAMPPSLPAMPPALPPPVTPAIAPAPPGVGGDAGELTMAQAAELPLSAAEEATAREMAAKEAAVAEEKARQKAAERAEEEAAYQQRVSEQLSEHEVEKQGAEEKLIEERRQKRAEIAARHAALQAEQEAPDAGAGADAAAPTESGATSAQAAQ